MLDDLFGLTGVALGALIVAVLSSRRNGPGKALWVAFILRTMMVLVNVYLYPLPGAQKDAVRFDRQAAQLADLGPSHLLENLHAGSGLYVWCMGVVYTFTTHSPFLADELNAILGTLVVWNVYRTIVQLTGDRQAARRGGWVVAVFPTLVLFAAVTLREAVIIYAFTLGVYHYVRWAKGRGFLHFVAALGLFVASAAFHTGMIGALGGLLVVIALEGVRSLRQRSRRLWLRVALALVPLVVAGGIIITTGIGLQKIGALQDFDLDTVGDQQSRAARQRAAYLQSFQMRSPVDVIWQTPIRAVYLLFTPFPWMVHAGVDVIGFFDALMYLAICIPLFRNRRYLYADPAARGTLVIAGMLILVFGIGTSNYGTGIRHRSKVVPVLVALALSARPRKRVVVARPAVRAALVAA